ncbi:hypothetical protein BG53_02135 [Paenibacillus darwinianus]|uniref:Uncharacterized protein n=1 Tax=Paenibacillus darwinianus TaxID=1380763 RepID=A0A9W5W7D0_9BACL|nr:hypothetical protein [Paenibacillus darwinianus]EXX88115.1 hypothetical protein BG52_02785 [Paenibacillus darwinianus]EXX88314.1 hypothetical protein BG53_02135 [Paenibacillus darwinianus]EXX89914.1 hypothetical protein CH50_00640 [Paenibacillus darwinianus]
MYQPGMYQNNQSFGQTSTGRYQPTGFGQSQFQSSSAAGNQGFGYSPAAAMQSQAGEEVHPVYRATNQRALEGPVIQHAGYQAGAQRNASQASYGGGSMMGGSMGFGYGGGSMMGGSMGSGYGGGSMMGNSMGSGFTGGTMTGGFAAQQGQEIHPVYRAQDQRSQEGPVIQRLGYQAGVQGDYNQGYANQGYANQIYTNQGTGMSYTTPAAQFGSTGSYGQNQFQQSSFQGGAVTPENPIYRLTNQAAQEGPVLSQVGYTAGGLASSQFGGSSGYQRY